MYRKAHQKVFHRLCDAAVEAVVALECFTILCFSLAMSSSELLLSELRVGDVAGSVCAMPKSKSSSSFLPLFLFIVFVGTEPKKRFVIYEMRGTYGEGAAQSAIYAHDSSL